MLLINLFAKNITARVGAGTNLKVGGGHRESGGGRRSGANRRTIFLVVPLHFFGSKSTISRSGERFRDGQYSLVSFLFAVSYSRFPHAQPSVKVGGTCPPGSLWG